MPLYEYECGSGHRFEEWHRIEDRHNVTCPLCSQPARLRISLSSFRMEEMATIRFADGRIYDQKPRGGAVPPPRKPTPEQRDRERALQHGG